MPTLCRPAPPPRPRDRCTCESLEPRALLASASTLAHDFSADLVGSDPTEFVDFDGAVYFFGNTGTGPALMRTDGTPAGTTAVRGALGYDPIGLAAAAGKLFFYGDDPVNGTEPWVSDGTAEGTRLLKDIAPGKYGSYWGFDPFLEAGGRAFFPATDGSAGQLWVTDGTPDGTHAVPGFNLRASPGAQSPTMASSGGRLYIAAPTDTGGTGLWTTDGTAEGTRLLRDFPPEVLTPPYVDRFTDVNGTLFFVAPAGPESHGELWKSDGTPEGTVLVKDIRPGFESSQPFQMRNVGGVLYFTADDGHGPRPWRSDGTGAGTYESRIHVAGSDTPLDAALVASAGGWAVFLSRREGAGWQLWRTDGTPAGTYLLKEFASDPEMGAGTPGDFRAVGDRLFFVASDGASDPQLWLTDGTPAGTRAVTGANPDGAGLVRLSDAAVLDGRLIFSAGRFNFGHVPTEPWISDGTAAGTHRLSDVSPTGVGFEPLIPISADRVLVDTGEGTLWAVDSANRTTRLADDVSLFSRPFDSRYARPSFAQLDNGVVVFAAHHLFSSASSIELYRTDGTADGTYRLADIDLNRNNFLGQAGVPQLVRFGDNVYFAAGETGPIDHGVELWRTDGTRAGTTLVRDVNVGPYNALAPAGDATGPTIAALGDTLYFAAMGTQLWRTDGTADGTRVVRDLGPQAGFGFGHFAAAGGRLLFTASSGGRVVLWRSDGTAAGTVPVGKQVSATGPIVSFAGDAYFLGSEGSRILALYRSDGTADGTTALTGSVFTSSREFVAAGSLLYLNASGMVYRTDGTAAGTQRLTTNQEAPASLASVGETLYFTAGDASHGYELWQSDGTAAGTRLAEDVWPGPVTSGIRSLTNVGGTLYFTAAEPRAGNELRRLDPRPRVAARESGSPTGGAAGANATTAPHKEALLPGRAGSFANVSADARGITRVLVDVFGLQDGATVNASDFALDVLGRDGWLPVPAAAELSTGSGVGGSDRFVLTLAPGAARNTWLRVTVKATPTTGFAAPDVFYFGNLVGDTGGPGAPAVNAVDLARTRANVGRTTATALAAYDFDGDGAVSASDVFIVRRNLHVALDPFTAPPAAPAAPISPASAGSSRRTPVRRAVLAEAAAGVLARQ